MRALLCLVSLLLPSAGGGADEPAAPQPVKLPDTAVEIVSGKPVQHTFAAPGEVLWLKFRAAGEGELLCRVKSGQTLAEVDVFDGAGKLLARSRPFASVPKGDCYLRLTCRVTDGKPAAVEVRFLRRPVFKPLPPLTQPVPRLPQPIPGPVAPPRRPEPEPVKLPDKAAAVEFGKPVELSFTGRQDVRWLQLRAPGEGYLHYTGKDLEARPEMFDDKGLPVGQTSRYFGCAAVRRGSYFLRLTPYAARTRGGSLTASFEPPDDYEPDDKPAAARAVRPGEDRKLRILPAGDVDHLRFEVSRPGYAMVWRPRDKKVYVRLQYALLDAAGKVVVAPAEELDSLGFDRNWAAFRVYPGRYTLAVSARTAFAAWKTVRLELLDETDIFEPNDAPELARSVPLNHPLPITMLPPDDEDWLRFTVPADGLLTLWEDGDKFGTMALEYDLREAKTGKGRKVSTYATIGRDEVRGVRLTKGEYLLGLSARRAGQKAEYMPLVAGKGGRQTQVVRLLFGPETDPHEPNDDPDTAPRAPREVRVRTFPPGDVDWFAVHVREVSTLRLLEPGPGRPDREGYILMPGTGKLVAAYERPVLTRGTYKVRLQLRPSVALQTVRFELEPVDDPYEPNDTRETARLVPLGEPIAFRIPLRDKDWFYFDAPSDGTAVFHFRTYPVPTVPAVGVCNPGDAKPTPIKWYSWGGGLYGGGGSNYQRAVPVRKGRVDFVVTDARGGGGNLLDLQVDFYPAGAPRDTNVFVIGFQTDERANEQFRAIAQAGGGAALATGTAAELPEVLTRTVRMTDEARAKRAAAAEPEAAEPPREAVARAHGPAGWPIAACVAGGLIVVGLAAAVCMRARARRARPPAGGS